MAYIPKNIKSLGGICGDKIYLLDANVNHTFGPIKQNYHRAAMVPAEGVPWQTVHFVYDTCSITEEPVEINGSIMYRVKGKMLISGDWYYIIDELVRMRSKRFHVLYTDSNHLTKMIGGRNKCGVQFRWVKRDNKTVQTERSEQEVEFIGTLPHPIATYPY